MASTVSPHGGDFVILNAMAPGFNAANQAELVGQLGKLLDSSEESLASKRVRVFVIKDLTCLTWSH
jgi:hypothetical protein